MNTHLAVRNELLKHIGRNNPITSTEISNILSISDDDGTRSITRRLIRETAKHYSLPILSCRDGYYLASNEKELAEYNKNMEARIHSMEERKRNVNKNYISYMKWYKKGVAYGILS